MHILHVLNSTSGGSALSTFEIIEGLQQQGIQSSLVCFNNGSPELRQQIAQKVQGRALFVPLYWTNKKIRAAAWKRPLLELYHTWRTWRGRKYQKAIHALARQHGATHIHTSTILNPEGALASKALGLPHIWHCRELIGPGQPFQFANFKSWGRWVASHAQVLVANSPATARLLQQHVPHPNTLTISNAINIESFSPRQHQQKSPLVVGMVGNLHARWKNHKLFLQVALQCLEQNLDVHFYIYGHKPAQDPYVQELQAMADPAGQRIQFKGFVPNPAHIMQQIDIMFHPAHQESFGRVYIEAMAAGLPVVAINQGAAADIIKHQQNGFLVPNDQPTAIVQQITQLVQNKELRQNIGTAALQEAQQKYAPQVLINNLLQAYQQASQLM